MLIVEGVFHVTNINNLIARNDSPLNGIPSSNGILVDRNLRYGSCTHGGMSGIYFHTHLDMELLGPDDIVLKIACVDSTELKTGMRCRSCVKGPFGEIARKVEVTHLIVPFRDVPGFFNPGRWLQKGGEETNDGSSSSHSMTANPGCTEVDRPMPPHLQWWTRDRTVRSDTPP